MTSGLFDKGITGEAGFSPAALTAKDLSELSLLTAAVEPQTIKAEPTAADLLEALTAGTEPNTLGDWDDGAITGEDLSDLVDPANEGFLDAFRDLSEYLMDSSEVSLTTDAPETVLVTAPEPVVEKRAVKRTAKAALTTVAPLPPNPDHSDYVSKAKRPRLSTTTSEDSECEAGPSGTSNTSQVQKYHERRRKNNIASKRSRETRKAKFSQMELKAIELEEANQELRTKVEELEKLTKQMKEILVNRLAHGK